MPQLGDHAAPDLGWHIVGAANVVAVVVAHGFLHACAALRDQSRSAGYRGYGWNTKGGLHAVARNRQG